MKTAQERKEKRRQRQEQVKAQQDKFAKLMSHSDDMGLKVLETEIAHLNRLNTLKSQLDQKILERLSRKKLSVSPDPAYQIWTSSSEIPQPPQKRILKPTVQFDLQKTDQEIR